MRARLHLRPAGLRRRGRAPLARALPPLIAPRWRVEGLGLALELLFAETDRPRCGYRLGDRIFEVVVIQSLRWLLDHPVEAGVRPGFVNGMAHLVWRAP